MLTDDTPGTLRARARREGVAAFALGFTASGVVMAGDPSSLSFPLMVFIVSLGALWPAFRA